MDPVAWMVEHEVGVRLGAFLVVIALLLVCERLWPARGDARPARRQAANLGLVVSYTALMRVAFPMLAVAWAMGVHAADGGLLGFVAWPLWVEVVVAVLVLDMAIYWQHRLVHAVPVLWRLHRVHHSDLAFDVTTGVRFHPFEIALSMGIKLALVSLLGPHPLAVVLFELALSLGALFTHTDIALPPGLDRRVRWLLVTPSMHRVHHSTLRHETDSNFGFHLSVWDRLFRTYRRHPERDERDMPIGIEHFRDAPSQGFLALLVQPFRRER